MLSRWAIKRICKFLLKKKLGDYILGDIDLDQLDVQLREGKIQLNDLALNVDFVNRKLCQVSGNFGILKNSLHIPLPLFLLLFFLCQLIDMPSFSFLIKWNLVYWNYKCRCSYIQKPRVMVIQLCMFPNDLSLSICSCSNVIALTPSVLVSVIVLLDYFHKIFKFITQNLFVVLDG